MNRVFLHQTYIMTKEQFKQDILEKVKRCPKEWRKGQSVFNIVDKQYTIARMVQFHDNVDCFYNDKQIDNFLDHVYKYLEEYDFWNNKS